MITLDSMVLFESNTSLNFHFQISVWRISPPLSLPAFPSFLPVPLPQISISWRRAHLPPLSCASPSVSFHPPASPSPSLLLPASNSHQCQEEAPSSLPLFPSLSPLLLPTPTPTPGEHTDTHSQVHEGRFYCQHQCWCTALGLSLLLSCGTQAAGQHLQHTEVCDLWGHGARGSSCMEMGFHSFG